MKKCFIFAMLALLSCEKDQNAFFVPIPITHFSSTETPCLEVEIEGQLFSLELDLGFQGHITLDEERLDTISDKTWVQNATIHGVQGKRYQGAVYQLPEIRMGNTQFTKPILHANSRAFTQDSVFVRQPKPIASPAPGRIGWQLFQNTPLLLDVPGNQIALCDSIETLIARGISPEFAVTELLTDRGLIEFEAMTSFGLLRCVLDTGSTLNAINDVSSPSIEESLWDPENSLVSERFQVGGENLGPIALQRIPIKIPIPIHVVLGMEFVRRHLIYIHFEEKQIYFFKRENVSGVISKGLMPKAPQ